MSLWSWLGKKIRLSSTDFWLNYLGGDSHAGKPVTVETALNISAWWACVRIYSETIATLPRGVYERQGSRRVRLDNHPLNDILNVSPNADQTPVEFIESLIAGVCMIGNGYAEKVMGNQGNIIALNPIPFQFCAPYRTASGALRYRYTDFDGNARDEPEENVFQIKGWGANRDLGYSPLTHARHTLGLSLVTDEAAGRVYGSGMRAGGFLMSPQVLDDNQRSQAREKLIKPMEGPESEGKIALLEAGWKFQPANIAPKDAEMLMSRRYNVEDVCRWMQTPPILIGHTPEGQTMFGSGVEQVMLHWLALGLRAFIRRVESAINRRLVPVAERGRVYVEFNIDGLVRPDTQSKAELFARYAQNGLRTRNELRALDNLEPMQGGDDLTVQSNLIPLPLLATLANGTPAQAREAARIVAEIIRKERSHELEKSS